MLCIYVVHIALLNLTICEYQKPHALSITHTVGSEQHNMATKMKIIANIKNINRKEFNKQVYIDKQCARGNSVKVKIGNHSLKAKAKWFKTRKKARAQAAITALFEPPICKSGRLTEGRRE